MYYFINRKKQKCSFLEEELKWDICGPSYLPVRALMWVPSTIDARHLLLSAFNSRGHHR